MKTSNSLSTILDVTCIVVLLLAVLLIGMETRTESVIVQASTAEAAALAVEQVGGTVTHELRTIRAVGAELSPTQRANLPAVLSEARVYDNASVSHSDALTEPMSIDTRVEQE
ncbi:MAG: hypothetical protein GY769_25490 [bacterium]|nr:hypothetical protein [bacterium]